MSQDDWKMMTFEELTGQIFHGELAIQEPIQMKNSIGDKIQSISFLSYLLQYHNIHKENIHHILMIVFSQFHQQINQMIQQNSIKPLFEQVLKEWESSEPQINLTSLSSEGEIDLLTMAQEASESCNDTERLISHSHNVPLESKLNGGSPLEREIGATTILCDKALDKLKKHHQLVDDGIDQITSFPINVFIDLSMKHKSLYLLMNQETDNQDIPDSIHQVFMNFVFITNLLKKQLIHQRNHILAVITQLEEQSQEVKDLNLNIRVLAFKGEGPIHTFF